MHILPDYPWVPYLCVWSDREARAVPQKRRIVVSTFVNGLAQLASLPAALVFMLWLIGRFGLTNYGIYLLATSIAGYVTILDLGVGASVMRMVSAKSAVGDLSSVSQLVSTAWRSTWALVLCGHPFSRVCGGRKPFPASRWLRHIAVALLRLGVFE